ncbi:MAG: NAD-dependent epimerase/dehydratase family protein [Saccharofermentans sp.]|nr:NAD-dependent epimerase/dehydratase family protein [Saccharofermentans sp.]
MSVKYLVSGGEGALGKFVISMLLERGEHVRILMSELSDTRIYRNNPNIEICYGISTDKDSMKEFFELDDPRLAVLFHTDEYVSLSDSTNLTMRRVNVIGAENVVDMCLKRKIGKLVYLSSAYALNPEVTGDNLTIHFDRNKVEGEYAKSKAEAAAYVMEKVALNKLNAVMVLPTFIIGPGYSEDYEINKVLNSFINNGTTPPKEGGRAFVDVRDVANAMLTLADKGEPGAGYIISGEYKTSGEFFKDVNDIQGVEAPVKTASRLVMSKSLVKLVNFYYKITHKENPREAYSLFSENPDARFSDNSKGILPENVISFKESLSDTISGAQQGGTQAAAASAQQANFDRKTSASAMEARLKQQSAVTRQASSVSTSAPPAKTSARPQAPASAQAQTPGQAQAQAPAQAQGHAPAQAQAAPERPARPRPLSVAAQVAASKAKAEAEAAAKAGGEKKEEGQAQASVKSIIPGKESAPAEPKPVEPVKSIIPDMAPKTEEPASEKVEDKTE